MTSTEIFRGTNWNSPEDPFDVQVFDQLVSQFWIPERIPLANDLKTWHQLTEAEQLLTRRVFTGLTVLDTLQGRSGAVSLLADAVTDIEEAWLSNIVFMECMTGEHELLTPNGWVAISKIDQSSLVAQYNPDTGQTEFVHPLATSSHVPEKTYLLESPKGHVRQHVSPGHRVTFERRSPITGSTDWSLNEVRADEFDGRHTNGFHRFINAAPTAAAGEGLTASDRLIIAFQADGSIDNASRNLDGELRRTGAISGTLPVRFCLSKQRKIDRLTALAAEAGWDLRESSHVAKNGTKNYLLYAPVDAIKDRFKKLEHFWRLDKKSATWCREFVEELAHWDGSHLGKDLVRYDTTDEDNASFVTAVATLAGYRSHTGLRVDDRSDRFSDSHIVTICLRRSTSGSQKVSVTEMPAERVYGVEVPSTFLVTRNGPSILVTGNCIHAKSYSNIFMTFCSTKEIDEAFRWSEESEELQFKARLCDSYYQGDDPLKRKIASVLLESFLFYSGFYLPLHWQSVGKLINTGDLIKMIIRDEAIHGQAIGYKYQRAVEKLSAAEQEAYKEFAYDTLEVLYANEVKYTQALYDEVGLTEEVKKFVRFNGNKALMNLGYDPLFPKEDVNPAIINGLSLGFVTQDFFSATGAYAMAKVEEVGDDDFDWDDDDL